MGVPASFDVGFIEVVQFQSFYITRPSLPTTLPPPSAPVLSHDDALGEFLGGVIFLLCAALAGYWNYIARKASQERQRPIDEERAPILPQTVLVREPERGNYNTMTTTPRPPSLLTTSIAGYHTPGEHSPVRQTPDELHVWATQYRELIPESLEAKLSRAGYLPGDNPGLATEDTWFSRWGVTVFELGRVQTAYEKEY